MKKLLFGLIFLALAGSAWADTTFLDDEFTDPGSYTQPINGMSPTFSSISATWSGSSGSFWRIGTYQSPNNVLGLSGTQDTAVINLGTTGATQTLTYSIQIYPDSACTMSTFWNGIYIRSSLDKTKFVFCGFEYFYVFSGVGHWATSLVIFSDDGTTINQSYVLETSTYGPTWIAPQWFPLKVTDDGTNINVYAGATAGDSVADTLYLTVSNTYQNTNAYTGIRVNSQTGGNYTPFFDTFTVKNIVMSTPTSTSTITQTSTPTPTNTPQATFTPTPVPYYANNFSGGEPPSNWTLYLGTTSNAFYCSGGKSILYTPSNAGYNHWYSNSVSTTDLVEQFTLSNFSANGTLNRLEIFFATGPYPANTILLSKTLNDSGVMQIQLPTDGSGAFWADVSKEFQPSSGDVWKIAYGQNVIDVWINGVLTSEFIRCAGTKSISVHPGIGLLCFGTGDSATAYFQNYVVWPWSAQDPTMTPTNPPTATPTPQAPIVWTEHFEPDWTYTSGTLDNFLDLDWYIQDGTGTDTYPDAYHSLQFSGGHGIFTAEYSSDWGIAYNSWLWSRGFDLLLGDSAVEMTIDSVTWGGSGPPYVMLALGWKYENIPGFGNDRNEIHVAVDGNSHTVNITPVAGQPWTGWQSTTNTAFAVFPGDTLKFYISGGIAALTKNSVIVWAMQNISGTQYQGTMGTGAYMPAVSGNSMSMSVSNLNVYNLEIPTSTPTITPTPTITFTPTITPTATLTPTPGINSQVFFDHFYRNGTLAGSLPDFSINSNTWNDLSGLWKTTTTGVEHGNTTFLGTGSGLRLYTGGYYDLSSLIYPVCYVVVLRPLELFESGTLRRGWTFRQGANGALNIIIDTTSSLGTTLTVRSWDSIGNTTNIASGFAPGVGPSRPSYSESSLSWIDTGNNITLFWNTLSGFGNYANITATSQILTTNTSLYNNQFETGPYFEYVQDYTVDLVSISQRYVSPTAQSFISPLNVLAPSNTDYSYIVVNSGPATISELTLNIPAGWSIPVTPTSVVLGGTVTLSNVNQQVNVNYASPWSAGSFDFIDMVATSPIIGAGYYWASYLNGGSYQCTTPTGLSQKVQTWINNLF